MPNRPRSHRLEDLSRNQLRDVFTRTGWVAWDLYPDYGEDLLVRIFIDGKATQFSFFVQAKATDTINKYAHKDGGHLSFPIDVDHIKYWNQFWEPVFLTVWDAASNITYWQVIQDCLEEDDVVRLTRKSIRIDIPLTNILNEKGIERIRSETIRRFKRFEQLSHGMDIVEDLLKEHADLEIEYAKGEELLTVKKPSGLSDWYIFGELAELAEKVAAKRGWSGGDFAVVQVMLNALNDDERFAGCQQYYEDGELTIRFKDGEIWRPFKKS